MDYKINFTDSARDDLKNISSFIEQEYLSKQAARQTIANIQEGLKNLFTFPEGFPNISERMGKEFDAEYDVRMIVLGKYLGFYFIQSDVLVDKDTGKEFQNIGILRMLNAKQNWIQILKESIS